MDFLKNIEKVSFQYDGIYMKQKATEINTIEKEDEIITEYFFENGVKVTNIARRIEKYDAYEWVTWFENAGEEKSGIFSDINDANAVFEFEKDIMPESRAFVPLENKLLVYNPTGAAAVGREEFFCYTGKEVNNSLTGSLLPNKRFEYKADGGRSSQKTAPFFNINRENCGVMVAIGWTGQWKCSIERDEKDVEVKTGIENVEFYLKPGERIRTSSVVIMRYNCSLEESFNKWRRLTREHYSLIGSEGRDKFAPLCFSLWGGMPSEKMVERIRGVGRRKLGYEYVWIDAGWNGCFKEQSLNEFEGEWAGCVGDWRINVNHHSDEFKEVKKAVAEEGLKLILWFEPERARKGTVLAAEHPEYFLKMRDKEGNENINYLLNLGDEKAFNYCYGFLSEMIEKLDIECYRQDFNFNPLDYWRQNDEDGRCGINEIKHINGLYRLWDMLLERFPGLIIDNCASGGRRIDIETMRRSVPLWRSDAQCPANPVPEIAQAHTMGFSLWMPHSSTGVGRLWGDEYRIRSAYGAGMTSNYWYSASDEFTITEEQEGWVKKYNNEFLKIRPYFSGDFYALTVNSLDDGAWCAYQLDRPENKDGVIVIFRRANSPYEKAVFDIKGLKCNENIQFCDADSNEIFEFNSEELNKGFSAEMKERRSSKILFYKKTDKR